MHSPASSKVQISQHKKSSSLEPQPNFPVFPPTKLKKLYRTFLSHLSRNTSCFVCPVRSVHLCLSCWIIKPARHTSQPHLLPRVPWCLTYCLVNERRDFRSNKFNYWTQPQIETCSTDKALPKLYKLSKE